MEINLKDLGLDEESIKSRIEDEVVSQVSEQITSSCVNEIKQKIHSTVLGRVQAIIIELVDKSLVETYQPVDDYGRAKGQPTSIREEFIKSCKEWWNHRVDSKGDLADGRYCSESMTRAEWFARKVFREVIDKDLRSDYDKLVTAGISKAKDALTVCIHETITKNWKL